MVNGNIDIYDGKGYDVVVWRHSVIVPTGAVVIRD